MRVAAFEYFVHLLSACEVCTRVVFKFPALDVAFRVQQCCDLHHTRSLRQACKSACDQQAVHRRVSWMIWRAHGSQQEVKRHSFFQGLKIILLGVVLIFVFTRWKAGLISPKLLNPAAAQTQPRRVWCGEFHRPGHWALPASGWSSGYGLAANCMGPGDGICFQLFFRHPCHTVFASFRLAYCCDHLWFRWAAAYSWDTRVPKAHATKNSVSPYKL